MRASIFIEVALSLKFKVVLFLNPKVKVTI